VQYFPADLSVSVKDGKFVTNVTEPYTLMLPDNPDRKEGDKQNIITIDTSVKSLSVTEFESYNTYVFLGEDYIMSVDDNGMKVIPLARELGEGFIVDQSKIREWTNWLVPVISNLIWFLPLFIYLGVYLSGVGGLIVSLVIALFVWLLTKLMKQNLGYKYAYRLTLHAYTLPLIISLGFGLNFLSSLALVLFVVWFNLFNNAKKHE
jgi:hypothetical protein